MTPLLHVHFAPLPHPVSKQYNNALPLLAFLSLHISSTRTLSLSSTTSPYLEAEHDLSCHDILLHHVLHWHHHHHDLSCTPPFVIRHVIRARTLPASHPLCRDLPSSSMTRAPFGYILLPLRGSSSVLYLFLSGGALQLGSFSFFLYRNSSRLLDRSSSSFSSCPSTSIASSISGFIILIPVTS